MKTLRLLAEVIRQMPTFYGNKVDRWLIAMHRPEDVNGATYCFGHGRRVTAWPCDDWNQAADRITARGGAA